MNPQHPQHPMQMQQVNPANVISQAMSMPVQGSYEQMVKTRLQQDPRLAKTFQQVMNMYGNVQDPWQIAFALMRERGIDPSILNMPRR